jgi:serine protease AprX
MRRVTRGSGARLVLAALTVTALLLPAQARAGSPYGDKVDAVVAGAAQLAAGDGQDLRVIVFGSDPAAALSGRGQRERHLGIIGAESARVPVGRLRALASDPRVDYVAPDLPVAPTAAGAPLAFPTLTTLYPQIDGAPAAWSSGFTGEGVGVAVVDSGVTPLPEFDSRLTRVTLSGQPTIEDTYGHGTFVAGVVGGVAADGRYVGIAPRASLYAIDVNDAGGVYTSNVIAGLDWIAANRTAYNIRVVNISLAETTASSYLTSALDAAVERLWSAGVVVVVSAGNLGPGTALYAPANDPFAISVGAVDDGSTTTAADDAPAAFSTSGVTQDGFSKPDLLAPGRRVPSVLSPTTTLGQQAPLANLIAPGYATMSGTSFASPQVAGAAALLLQAHPEWTPDQVKWVLGATAHPVVGAGAGALSVDGALLFAGTPGSANQGVAPAPQAGSDSTSTLTSNTNSWNTNSWNTNSWNTNSWNTNSWNFSAWD